ncbi:MAG: phosphatidate cytidylyltransferase, partial [Dehalococcoidia bacterium]|nr:phosphatidate cytidylyltransferase [Dehalococcoidia bacterium]
MTAAVGLPLVAGVIWIGGWAFALVAAAIALLAAAEFTHGWLIPSMPVRAVLRFAPFFGTSAIMVAGVHASYHFLWLGAGGVLLTGAAGYSWSNRFGPRKPYRVQAWCLVYVGFLMSTLVLVRDIEDGRSWVLLGVLVTFAVDTGAYAVGRAIGRHKLAPRISPGKTREGAVGGWATGTAAVFGLNALFDTGVDAGTVAPFAVLMPLAAQTGDLFESWMK